LLQKRISAFERATLIQDQAPRRNVDSKFCSPSIRLLRIFNFQRLRADLATISAHDRPGTGPIAGACEGIVPSGHDVDGEAGAFLLPRQGAGYHRTARTTARAGEAKRICWPESCFQKRCNKFPFRIRSSVPENNIIRVHG
jgi:hypothetical protein